jgi:hypothetical protein
MSQQTDAEKRRKEVMALLDLGVDSVYFQHGTKLPIFTRQAGQPASFPPEETNHGVRISTNQIPHI